MLASYCVHASVEKFKAPINIIVELNFRKALLVIAADRGQIVLRHAPGVKPRAGRSK